MGLHLSDRKLRELEDLHAHLAAPLETDGEGEWLDGMNLRLQRFFEADGVMSIVPGRAAAPIFRFHEIDPEAARELEAMVVGMADETLRFRYPNLDRYMRRVAAAGVRVWTPEMGARISRIRMEDVGYHHDIVVPYRMAHQISLSVPVSDGPAMIAFYHHSPARDPFGSDRVPLLRLLLPGYRSGVRMLRLFERGREVLERELAAHGDAILLFDAGSRLIYRNPAAARLLAIPSGETLAEHARALAARLRSLREPPRKSAASAPRLVDPSILRAGSSRFRLSATFLPSGLMTREGAVLVRVAPLTPPMPTTQEIVERFGLTPRQAEVAGLIAQDLTTREVAERLSISVHTVERHAERILRALGLRSRKGLGARLLGSG